MGNITQLKQGSLNGLRRQTNECIDNAYRKGYEDGKKEPREVANVEDTNEYQIGYKVGLEDGNKIADKNLKEIRDSACDVAYNKALKDTDHAMDVLKSMTGTECAEWFEDCVGVDEVVCGFTVQRIVEIIKAYEEKKKSEEIKVGDVVQQKGAIMIVTRVNNIAKTISGVNKDGEYFERDMYKWHKTDRHFDEVEQLLDKLKG